MQANLLEYYEKEYTDWFVNHFGSNAEPLFFFELVEARDKDYAHVKLALDDLTSIELLCPMRDGLPYSVNPPKYTWVPILNKVLIKYNGKLIYGHVLHLIHFCYLSDKPFSNDLEHHYFQSTYKIMGQEWSQILESKIESVVQKAVFIPTLPIMYKDPVRILAHDVMVINNNSKFLVVEPVKNNLYELVIKFHNFDPKSQIFSDLKERNIEFVEMKLMFHKDAYPFYPPTGDFLYPRLKGIDGSSYLSLRLTEPLHFDYWDPAQPLLTYLKDIFGLLQKDARVDEEPIEYDNEMLERSLIHLEKHFDRQPNSKFTQFTIIPPPTNSITDAATVQPAAVKESVEVAEHKGWAKGIGYGSNEHQNLLLPRKSEAYRKTRQKLLHERTLLNPIEEDCPNKKKARTSTADAKLLFASQTSSYTVAQPSILSKTYLLGDEGASAVASASNSSSSSGSSASKTSPGYQGKFVKLYKSLKKKKDEVESTSSLPSIVQVENSVDDPMHGAAYLAEVDSGAIMVEDWEDPSIEMDYMMPGITQNTSGMSGLKDLVQKERLPDYMYDYSFSKYMTSRIIWSKESYILAKAFRKDQALLALREVYFATRDELPTKVFTLIKDSVLLPFLEDNLFSVTLLEAFAKSEVYLTCLALISKIVLNEDILHLFANYKDGLFYQYLRNVAPEAETGLQLLEQSAKNNASISLFSISVPEQINQGLVKLYRLFTEMKPSIRPEAPIEEEEVEPSSSEGNPASPCLGLDDKYKLWLKPLQFQTCAMNMPDAKTSLSGAQVLRISHELKSLAQGALPLDIRTSIFVRSNENNLATLTALITGPEDTPYAHGCYFFDFVFPDTYPQQPPKVAFVNRATGSQRINPNLYNTGYICLSLLGTWLGAKMEQWSPSTSTTLQVLISIQSMIFTSQPYFNEPGYERQINTTRGNELSKQYNQNVYIHTIEKAMLSIINSPPAHFAEVVKRHFYLKKNLIIEQTEKWVNEVKSKKIERLHNQLKSELSKIKPPEEFSQ